jgi:hypothetical protein
LFFSTLIIKYEKVILKPDQNLETPEIKVIFKKKKKISFGYSNFRLISK